MENLIPLVLPYLLLALATPLGKILANLTTHEPQIYNKKQYFPTIQKLLLITAAITISQNQPTFLATTFLVILIQSWRKSK
jgi:hypothetical protein